jgi:hypothetical protein
VARMWRSAYSDLVEKRAGSRPLERLRNTWEGNIKREPVLVERERLDCIYVGHVRNKVAGCGERGDEPSDSITCRESVCYLRTC